MAGPVDVDRATGPFACLLAADGLAVTAGALADVLARGTGTDAAGSAGCISLAYALGEAGLVARVMPAQRSVPAEAAGPAAQRSGTTPAPTVAPSGLGALAREVPVLRALREATGRRWAVPVLVVAIHQEDDDTDALVAVADRWLSSTVEDLVVVVPRRLPEYDGDPRVAVAGSEPAPAAPFLLHWPASLAPGLRTGAGLLDLALAHGCGLLRVRTPGRDETPALTRTAVVERLMRAGVTAPGAADFEAADGTWWADGGQLGVTVTADLPPGPVTWQRLDGPGWQRIRDLEAEVARLTAEESDAPGPAARSRARRRWRPKSQS